MKLHAEETIDETGKSELWIKHYGRAAMAAKIEQYQANIAAPEPKMSARKAARTALYAEADYCEETGRTGEEE